MVASVFKTSEVGEPLSYEMQVREWHSPVSHYTLNNAFTRVLLKQKFAYIHTYIHTYIHKIHTLHEDLKVFLRYFKNRDRHHISPSDPISDSNSFRSITAGTGISTAASTTHITLHKNISSALS